MSRSSVGAPPLHAAASAGPLPERSAGRSTVTGTIQVFLAESLLLPTGLITAGFLTRELGPEGYGLFTLAATIVACLSWILPSALGRASIQSVGRAADWEPIASTLLRVYLLGGLLFGAGLVALSGPISKVFGEPQLHRYLVVFSVELLLFGAVHAHRAILVGAGRYSARAQAAAARSIARLILILALVGAGLSVTGAILGSIAAFLIELLVCRRHIRPRLHHKLRPAAATFLGHAAPLIAFGVCMRVFDRIDLFALKALGASAATAGYYGAAQNLAIVPGLFAMSLAPLLLSTLTRVKRVGAARHQAWTLARNAIRFTLAVLPFAAVVVAAAPAITSAIFGAEFAATAPLLSWLILASAGQMVVAVATAVVIAAGRPRWAFYLAGSMLGGAVAGLLIVVPRFGAAGGASLMSAVAGLGAIAALAAVSHLGLRFPLPTLLRTLLVSGLAYGTALYWAAEDLSLVVMLVFFTFAVPGSFLLLGEVTPTERRALVSWLRAARSGPAR